MDLTLFFRLSPDALFVGNFLGRIKEVNAAALQTQGVTREELIGRSFVSLAHPADLPRVAAEIADAEREHLVAELPEAVGQAKTLRGLLPICRYCKRNRDDDGAWQAMESYIRDRSDRP